MKSSNWENKKAAALSVPIAVIADHEGIRLDPKSRNRYYSPFRDEKSPSFIVYPKENRWVDFGRIDGHRSGDGINLIQELKRFNFKEAVDYLLSLDGKDILQVSPPPVQKYGVVTHYINTSQRLDKVVDLWSRPLVNYLAARHIPVGVARQYCKEVHYTYCPNGRKYYAIGFANDASGWAVRTAPYPGAPKGKKMDILASGITTIRTRKGSVHSEAYVFEGFLNFLSWVVLYGAPERDVVVLNSVENVGALSDVRSAGTKVLHCYLDNDTPGNSALDFLREKSGCDVIDCSGVYRNVDLNDLNDYLCLV